jgi:hypothetical protein
MAQDMRRLGAAAVIAVTLAGCAEARMSDNGSPTSTVGAYGIPSDAGSHGSVYSWLFGSNNQSVADARVAAPSGAGSTTASGAPPQPGAASPATPVVAAATPTPTVGSYGIPSDAGSHGSLYSYLFGQNGKPPQVSSGTPVPVTSYGIPADAGSHGSVYSWLFGPKDAPATASNGSADPSAARPNAAPASQ